MSIFDFLKKFKKTEPEIVATEKIKFSELHSFSKNKKEQLQSQEKGFLIELKEINNDLMKNLQEKIIQLENLDLEQKKADDKIKIIVKENFKSYIYSVGILINDMSNLNELNSSTEMINKINFTFATFQKKSNTSYQKATYLIGELGQIKDEITNYFKKIEDSIEENKEIIKISKTLDAMGKKLQELSQIDNASQEIKNEMTAKEEKINQSNNKITDRQQAIIKIENSAEHKAMLKDQETLINKNNELENKINKLKALVDFKVLSSVYHKSEKDMTTIKDYRNNFINAFQEDSDNKLRDIIEATSQIDNKDQIYEQLTSITNLKKQIKTIKESINNNSEKEIQRINEQTKNLNSEINNLNIHIEKENKRFEKSRENKNSTLNALKEILKEINVELE